MARSASGGPEVSPLALGATWDSMRCVVQSQSVFTIPCMLVEKVLFCRLLPISLSVRFCAVKSPRYFAASP